MSDVTDSENEALSGSVDIMASSSSEASTSTSTTSSQPTSRRSGGASRLQEILRVGPTTRPDNRFLRELGVGAPDQQAEVGQVAEEARERSAGQVGTSGREGSEDPDSPPPAGEALAGRGRLASRGQRINNVRVYRRSDQEMEQLAGGRPVYSVDFYTSAVTLGYLAALRREFRIPDDVVLMVPGSNDLPSRPPPGYIALSAEYFRAGLRLPFHPFLRRALTRLNVAPAQLNANAYRILVSCFILWSKQYAEELPFSAFQNLYRMKSAPSSAGSYYFQGFKGSFITKCPDSDKQFKHLWFYAGGRWLHGHLLRGQLDPSERVPVVFRRGYVWTRTPHIPEETRGLVNELQGLEEGERDHRLLLGESSLTEHGWLGFSSTSRMPSTPRSEEVTVARMPDPAVQHQVRTGEAAAGVAPARSQARGVAVASSSNDPPPTAPSPESWGPRVADEDLDLVIRRLSPAHGPRHARGIRIQGRRRSHAERRSR